MIKLCVSDSDFTLMDREIVDILANAYGVGDEVKIITQKAMSRELDSFESLHQRVALPKGMSCDDVLRVSRSLPLTKGSFELIEFLNSKNVICAVFSRGFREGVDYVTKKLNFKLSFVNYLHHKNGKFTGLVDGGMMLSDSKGLMLERLEQFLNLNQEEVTYVEDEVNDSVMLEYSGFKIALCAKETLRANASVCIDVKDLRETMKVM